MIQQIFPINIYSTTHESDLGSIINLLEREKRFTQSIDGELEQNFGHRSENTYLLDNKKYKELQIWIENHLSIYAKDYLGLEFEQISLTQSWISIKKPGQSHNVHRHPNSLISGVFYWQDNVESMYFKRPSFNQFFQVQQNQTPYFSEYEEFKPSKNSLILFPSFLEHYVGTNKSKDDRYCLPFNSMIFGKIGKETLLTELIINK